MSDIKKSLDALLQAVAEVKQRYLVPGPEPDKYQISMQMPDKGALPRLGRAYDDLIESFKQAIEEMKT